MTHQARWIHYPAPLAQDCCSPTELATSTRGKIDIQLKQNLTLASSDFAPCLNSKKSKRKNSLRNTISVWER
eukprot:6130650-Amphidinium_carterae.2